MTRKIILIILLILVIGGLIPAIISYQNNFFGFSFSTFYDCDIEISDKMQKQKDNFYYYVNIPQNPVPTWIYRNILVRRSKIIDVSYSQSNEYWTIQDYSWFNIPLGQARKVLVVGEA